MFELFKRRKKSRAFLRDFSRKHFMIETVRNLKVFIKHDNSSTIYSDFQKLDCKFLPLIEDNIKNLPDDWLVIIYKNDDESLDFRNKPPKVNLQNYYDI